jgi:hypothetical protein
MLNEIKDKDVLDVLTLAHSLKSINQFNNLIDNISKMEAEDGSLINKFIMIGNIHFLKNEFLKNNKGVK